MKFSELMDRLKARGVEVVGCAGDAEIVGVCEDSRKVRVGDLFFARGGTKTDGGRFVAEAVAGGAVAVLVSGHLLPWSVVSGQKEVAHAVVKDVNLACAIAAHEVAGNPTTGMKVIGITGTKGKTTVAYLLRSVLKGAGLKVGMIGTVEIDDGVSVVPADMTTPGSVELVSLFKKMRGNGVTHVVMEVSSHALHQHRVAGIEFAVGVFTNLTGDHLDYHGTMEEYAAAKGMLFEGLGEGAVAVVNVDDEWYPLIIQDCRASVSRFRLLDLREIETDWAVDIKDMSSDQMSVRLLRGKDSKEFVTPLIGRHNAYNLVSVVAAAEACGIDWTVSTKTLERERESPGRLQRVHSDTDFSVFVDYAHTHDSLYNVLGALRPACAGRLICVFGCGGDRDRTKRPKMAKAAEIFADRIIVTSDNPRTENPEAIIDEICAGFSPNWQQKRKINVEPDRRKAIHLALSEARTGDMVLIAGKGHENYQIVGTVKHHFDDVEEAEKALAMRMGGDSDVHK